MVTIMKKKILLLLASSLFLAGCSQGDAPSSSVNESSSEPSAAGWAGLEGSETYTKLSDFLSENGITDISDFPYMDVSQGTEWSYDYNSTHTMFGLVALTGGNRNNNAILINAYKEKLSGVGYTNPTEDELNSFIYDNYDVFYNPDVLENIFAMGDTGLALEVLDIGSTEFVDWSTPAPVVPDGTAANEFTEGIMISIQVLEY